MKQLPHIAIIMDGNGRWASQRSKPRFFGHIKGVRVAKKIITECVKLKMNHLTLYAFSSENWFRPKDEVSLLMILLKKYLQKELASLMEQNIKFQVIGEIDRLPLTVQEEINKTIRTTDKNTGMILTFALSYGSRQEITNAVKNISHKVKLGLINPEEITEELIHKNLNNLNLPDPDLIIRTSGENRLSNFMLWQSAYTEFYFTKTLWPDFTEAELGTAIHNYLMRERRYGKTSQQIIESKNENTSN